MKKDNQRPQKGNTEEYRTRNHPTEGVNMNAGYEREEEETEENKVIPGSMRNQSDPNVK